MVAREGSNSYGELYALTVDDLLFDLNVIYINKSMYRQKTGSPKTKNATRWVKTKDTPRKLRCSQQAPSSAASKTRTETRRYARVQTSSSEHVSHGRNSNRGNQEVDWSR